MKKILFALLSLSVLLAACVKPEEGTTVEEKRKEKLNQYLHRAKAANELDARRLKVLDVPNPLDISHILNKGQSIRINSLKKAFEENADHIQKDLQQHYTDKITEDVTKLFEQYKEQARQAAQTAVSPWDLGAKLTSLKMSQDKEIEEFISKQTAMARLQPDEKLVEQTREHLLQRCDGIMERIQRYYGNDTAATCQPVLDQAVYDYTKALTSPANEQELKTEIDNIIGKTQNKLDEILSASNDPIGVTSEETQKTLRREMILAHQEFEKEVETLYGKNAVLQTREVFNHLLAETQKVLQTNMYLSHKKTLLEYLNADYRRKILALQAQWNEELSLPAPIVSEEETSKSV